MVEQCTRSKPLHMVIPPEGINVYCPVHTGGHFIPGPHKVVWSGRDALLPDRSERWDRRYAGMPSLDLDEGEAEEIIPKRKYTKTGKHVGKCSRTDPNAPQYLPSKSRLAASSKETETNG